MEVGGGFPGFKHDDTCLAQVKVQRLAQTQTIDLPLQVEMRDLSQRVNSAIGSPGSGNSDPLAAEILNRPYQRVLHRDARLRRSLLR